jgi:isopentenyl-diphosphate delta-isomerase
VEENSTLAFRPRTRTCARKSDHLRICLEKDVRFFKKTGFELHEFQHQALPGIDLDEIDTTTFFLGREFRLPFFIEALTGGTPAGRKINRNLARAAQETGIGMGLGSQRAMLEDPSVASTYLVRDVAPDIFLLGNIGASQLAGLSIPDVEAMVGFVEADGLAIHLNPCHEVGQPEGDSNWSNVLEHIGALCNGVSFPVVVKEVGCGISGAVARRLQAAGAAAIDVAGAGGTCFARVEYYRGSRTAEAFFEWGIPTAQALGQCKEAVELPLIASGGIRSGVECAKAIAIGATLAGFALPILKPALKSHHAVVHRINQFAVELRKAMLLVGVKSISELRTAGIGTV